MGTEVPCPGGAIPAEPQHSTSDQCQEELWTSAAGHANVKVQEERRGQEKCWQG